MPRKKANKRFLKPATVKAMCNRWRQGQPLAIVWLDSGKSIEAEAKESDSPLDIMLTSGCFWRRKDGALCVSADYDLTERRNQGLVQSVSIHTIYRIYEVGDMREIEAYAEGE